MSKESKDEDGERRLQYETAIEYYEKALHLSEEAEDKNGERILK